jgi:hypothetical protein
VEVRIKLSAWVFILFFELTLQQRCTVGAGSSKLLSQASSDGAAANFVAAVVTSGCDSVCAPETCCCRLPTALAHQCVDLRQKLIIEKINFHYKVSIRNVRVTTVRVTLWDKLARLPSLSSHDAWSI